MCDELGADLDWSILDPDKLSNNFNGYSSIDFPLLWLTVKPHIERVKCINLLIFIKLSNSFMVNSAPPRKIVSPCSWLYLVTMRKPFYLKPRRDWKRSWKVLFLRIRSLKIAGFYLLTMAQRIKPGKSFRSSIKKTRFSAEQPSPATGGIRMRF